LSGGALYRDESLQWIQERLSDKGEHAKRRITLMNWRPQTILFWITFVAAITPIRAQNNNRAANGATTADWPEYGGTGLAWRYSSLDQINTSNIKRLAPAWSFETGDYQDGMASTPVVIDGIVYISTASSWVIALNGATGDPIWRYKYEPPVGLPAPRSNHGLAVEMAKSSSIHAITIWLRSTQRRAKRRGESPMETC
jgi:outer membrane protein assembly factor BamB